MKVYSKIQKDIQYDILLDDDVYDYIVSNKILLLVDVGIKKKYNRPYVYFKINRKNIRLHRFITNCPKDKVVDHINHNTLDNRRCNLRICTARENSMNRSDNNTGCCGVHYIKRDNTYRATISINGKLVHLGQSKDINKAIEMRINAEKKYYPNLSRISTVTNVLE